MSRIDDLEARLTVVEERLGIDVDAIVADETEQAERGAEQHALSQSALEGPGGQDVGDAAVKSDALAKAANIDASDEEAVADALHHIELALEKWPDDQDLLAARDDLAGASS